MKNTLLLILLALSFQTKAQVVDASTSIPTNEYLDLLAANLVIPDSVQQKFINQDLNLTIVLTITKNGSVFNPKIQNDSLQLESNLKKAIEKLPKWNPKTEDGVAVVSRKVFNLLIPIKMEEQNFNNTSKAIPEAGKMEYFRQFMQTFNIKNYSAKDKSEISIVATFIVEEDGSLTNIKIIESNEPSLNREVVRAIKSMPKWKPATENGIPIRSDFKLPIKIRIN